MPDNKEKKEKAKEGNIMESTKHLALEQTLPYPVNGYWDGGKKQTFVWHIEGHWEGHNSKGTFIRIGSWQANHWFHVAKGKTEKNHLMQCQKAS